jgi:hypothetical protein
MHHNLSSTLRKICQRKSQSKRSQAIAALGFAEWPLKISGTLLQAL